MTPDELLERVRAHVLSLPRTVERTSHGAPAFFIEKGRQIGFFATDDRDGGRPSLWLTAPQGLQEALVAEDAEVYFRPPYVGSRGWVGVWLDRGLAWETVTELIDGAHEFAMRK